MAKYAQDVATRRKNATQKQPAREDQVKNNAGGFVFSLDPWAQLERFLVLGTMGGTYYVSQRDHTQDNMNVVDACIREDGLRVINTIVEISDKGRAIKNEPAIVVLARCLAIGDETTKVAARKAVPKVCRIGTHIFQLAEYIQVFRGWGSAARKAVQAWFYDKNTHQLAYQAIKYPQRQGWAMRDLLRLSHYAPLSERRKALMDYICGREIAPDHDELEQVYATMKIKKATSADEAAGLIKEYALPREVVPTEFLNEVKVWEALAEQMPMTAMIRNLGKMSQIGLIKPLGKYEKQVVTQLTNAQALKRARVHPLTILQAWAVYRNGQGLRGNLTWSPSAKVVDALEEAYYKSFEFVRPSGKRFYLGLDVSGSMAKHLNDSFLSCAQGAACMAATTVEAEDNTYVAGFCGSWTTTEMQPIGLTKKSGLSGGIKVRGFGSTDCAMPMLDAIKKDLEVDVFVIYTDNETWAGNVHPYKALQQYREHSGINAKLVVVGMVSTGFSIADPKDPGMLDVVGFDTNTPQAISAFAE